MTTIISRVFPDTASAKKAADRLKVRGLPSRALLIIAGSDDEALAAIMETARIDDSARAPYLKAVKSGQAVLVVHATYKPLTAATIVRGTLAKYDTVDMGDVVEDYFVPDGPPKAESILKDHPLFLTSRSNRNSHQGGLISKGLGFNLLKPHKDRNSATRGGGFTSRLFWPMPLLSKKERKSSVLRDVRPMSSTQ